MNEALLTRPEKASNTALREGSQFGPYVIDKLIGRGGMGSVFKATHSLLGREAAVKVLLSKFVDDEKFRTMFIEEAKAMAAMDHRNLLPVMDFGIENGRLWMATKLMSGDMSDYIKDNGRLKMKNLLGAIRAVNTGLAAIHEAGLIHRDIKPSNVFFSKDEIRLADFGLITEPLQEIDSSNLGTPAYAAPEVIRQKPVDGRSDIYAIGATMYYMATGMHPFDGSTSENILRKVLTGPTPDPREYRHDIFPDIACLIMRMMHKDPAERPQTTQAVHEELDVVGRELSKATEMDPFETENQEPEAAQSEAKPGLFTRMFRKQANQGAEKGADQDKNIPASAKRRQRKTTPR